MEDTRDTSCGKTCRERFQVIKGEPFKPSSKRSAPSKTAQFQFLNLKGQAEKMEQTSLFGLNPEPSWETVTPLRGEFSTLNIGECPSVERVSTLSQILILNAPEKYSLSPTACEGICNRAMKRGKKLPLMLWDALMEVLESMKVTLFDAFQHHGWRQGDTCGTLTAGQNNGVRGDTPLVVTTMATQQGGAEIAENLCPTITAAGFKYGNSAQARSIGYEEEMSQRFLVRREGMSCQQFAMHFKATGLTVRSTQDATAAVGEKTSATR